MKSLNRRHFLRGVGVSLALPILESRGTPSASSSDTINRFVAINLPLGFHPPRFFPTTTGRDYQTSEYLKAADHLRNDFTLISGTSHPEVDGGHSAEKSFLTAAPHPAERGFKNRISVDQVIAKQIGDSTRFASLSIGDHSLSWTANGVSIPQVISPALLFNNLFLTGNEWELQQRRKQLADGHSIIDSVLEEANAMKREISRADQEKMDQYFTAVRETEGRLTKADRWLDTPKPKVEAQQPKDSRSIDIEEWTRSHLEVSRLALMTDSTRVISFGAAGHGSVVPLPGVTMGYHGLSHHGKNPDMLRQLGVIEHAMIKVWVEFIQSLKDTPDGDGTLLDHTQVLLGSNLGNASGHLTTNLPILLAGGGYQHGQHLAFDSKNNYPLPNLFVSMMQRLGLEEERFASSTGTMTGLS
ncbi:MAG: DUF1552 domain-containing protein [Verrucomicrobiota bacterium]